MLEKITTSFYLLFLACYFFQLLVLYIYIYYICIYIIDINIHKIYIHIYTLMKCIFNQFHNILRLFDVLPNFPFTASKTMSDYYL